MTILIITNIIGYCVVIYVLKDSKVLKKNGRHRLSQK